MKNMIERYYDMASPKMQVFFWFIIGCFVLATAAHLIGVINKHGIEYVFWYTTRYFSILNFFDQHQTIFAGALAMLGAIATIKKMQAQIDKTEELAESARKRKLKAARAVAPLALSSLYNYAEKTGNALSSLYPLLERGRPQNDTFLDAAETSLLIDFPLEALSTIKEITEHESDAHIHLFAHICALCQLINARAESVRFLRSSGTFISPTNIVNYTLDCADLMSRIGAMFEYVRNSENTTIKDHNEFLRGSLNIIIAPGVISDDFTIQNNKNLEANFYNLRFSR